MAQIVHGPAIFDDEERYPFGIVLCKENPYPENQGEGFYEPKDAVKDLLVARLGFVVGDVSEKLPHGKTAGAHPQKIIRNSAIYFLLKRQSSCILPSICTSRSRTQRPVCAFG